LQAVKRWESARLAGAFPASVKAALREDTREFHLETAAPGKWELFEAYSVRFTHDASNGKATVFQFQNPNAEQPMQWIVRSTGKQPVTGVTVQINGKPAVNLKANPLPPGGSLRYYGGAETVICDASCKELARVLVDASAARVSQGVQTVQIECAPQVDANLKIELRTLSKATRIERN